MNSLDIIVGVGEIISSDKISLRYDAQLQTQQSHI